MSKTTLAETGWLDFTIDHLRESLKAAENTASDIVRLRMCDAAGCGRMFDSGDPRAAKAVEGHITYDFCPACEMEAQREADKDRPTSVSPKQQQEPNR